MLLKRRFRELKRVTAIYKTYYEQELTHVVVSERQSLHQESLAAEFEPENYWLCKIHKAKTLEQLEAAIRSPVVVIYPRQ